MKHLIMTGMFFVLAFAPLSAEVIQTINFNPARLGQYERLKVSEKATFPKAHSRTMSSIISRPNLPWTFPVRVSLLWKIA